MQKNVKIIIAAVAAVAVVVICVAVGFSFGKAERETTFADGESDSFVEATQAPTAQTTTAEPKTLSRLIIGKWMDSAGMSGYEFFSDGTAAFTYINLESFDIPFDGTARNAVYTLEGNTLTLKYSIYTATIEKKYEVSVDGDTLYMKDLENNETGTYRRTASSGDTTQPTEDNTTGAEETTGIYTPGNTADDLIGSWENTSIGVKYNFKGDGIVSVGLENASLYAYGSEKISANVEGTYTVENGIVTVKYTILTTNIVSKYAFEVSKNSLKFTDETGKTEFFTRIGTTSYGPSDESDLLGTWRDGANMSGYEFKENGIAKVTFVDFTIPVINMPINGTFTGNYSVDGNEITISYSIYGNTIGSTYSYSINGNVLTLTEKDSGNVSTYIKK